MNYLKNKRTYLSGPIQHGDPNSNWRDGVKKFLKEELQVDLFDPFSDPKQQWVPALEKAQKEDDIDTIVKITKAFVRKDLAMVDRSDFLVAFLPYKVITTGTHHEIINSSNAKKPTLLVTNANITSIPLWYFGFIPTEFMFPNWESLFAYLREVDEGKHMDNDRWAFVYGLI